MTDGKKLLADVKKKAKNEVQAEKKARGETHLVARLVMGFLDTLAAVAVLALALLGALQLIDTHFTGEIKLGIAIFVIGLLATRILERAFQVRR